MTVLRFPGELYCLRFFLEGVYMSLTAEQRPRGSLAKAALLRIGAGSVATPGREHLVSPGEALTLPRLWRLLGIGWRNFGWGLQRRAILRGRRDFGHIQSQSPTVRLLSDVVRCLFPRVNADDWVSADGTLDWVFALVPS